MFERHPNLSDAINDAIIESELQGGAWIKNVPEGKGLNIQTRNTLYQLRHLVGGEWTIDGSSRFCPSATPCKVQGSTWGGSMIKVGFIGRGMHLEVWIKGVGTIITSTILEITEA